MRAVKVYNRADCCGSRLSPFDVRIGNMPVPFVNSKCGHEHSILQGAFKTVNCKKKEGRYLSVNIPKSKKDKLTLCEVVVDGEYLNNGDLAWLLKGGDGWIQLGAWRMGHVPKCGTGKKGCFSFSHEDGVTAMFFDNNGKIYNGPVKQFGLWFNAAGTKIKKGIVTGVTFGDGFIQFADMWRIGDKAGKELTISYSIDGGKSGVTVVEYKLDGTQRTKLPIGSASTWARPLNSIRVAIGDRFIQLGMVAGWR